MRLGVVYLVKMGTKAKRLNSKTNIWESFVTSKNVSYNSDDFAEQFAEDDLIICKCCRSKKEVNIKVPDKKYPNVIFNGQDLYEMRVGWRD